MSELAIYGDARSGNCLKVKWTADRLGLPYRWVTVEVGTDAVRQPEFLALNPFGQVPVVVLPDGRTLAQSNAILLYLAEGSSLIPEDAYDRARMFEWMFWEQYSHEPYIAVRRYQMTIVGRRAEELDPKLEERGVLALQHMEEALRAQPFLAGFEFSLADVALAAYTRVAPEGGFDLSPYPRLRAWIAQVERELRIA